ncbi:ABC transporter, partial [Crocosphaera watsonii WH 0003]
LVEKFTPYKEVNVELSYPLSSEKLAHYGQVETMKGQEVRFLVKQEDLTDTIAKILAQLEVNDLSVSDPPIEEVVSQIFSRGNVDL